MYSKWHINDTYINYVLKGLFFFPYLQNRQVVDSYLNYTKPYVQFQIKTIDPKSYLLSEH